MTLTRADPPPRHGDPPPADPPEDVADVRGVGRCEWEQVIRRARLDGLIQGKPGREGRPSRGGVSGSLFKAVAMVLASYSDGDTGRNVRPGDATVAVEAETSVSTVKLIKAALIKLDMLRRTRAGARRLRDPDVYQLTLPADILDRLDVLTPAQVRVAAERLADRHRGKRKGSSGPPTKDVEQVPPDPAQHAGDTIVGVPPDTAQPEPADGCGGASGPARDGCGGATGPVVGDPPDPPTNQDQPPNLTNHRDGDVRTAVAVARVGTPSQDPIRLAAPPGPTGPGDRAPAVPITTAEAAELKERGVPLPRCEHGMHNLVRERDGQHCCPACRRGLPAEPPATTARTVGQPPPTTWPPGARISPSASAQSATVLPFRPRTRSREEPA